MTEYRVDVESYNGPLDLLLFLIRRQEVSIYDVPIARVAEQYRAFVDVIQLIDPNVAGDFIVMLATLIEIKSASMLPRVAAPSDDEDEGPIDPRSDLIRQLLAYKSFKDAARRLGTAAEIQALRFPRQPADLPVEPGEVDVEDVSIWTLVNAFGNLLEQIGKTKEFHEVVYDETPLALHADDIVDSLQREGGSQRFDAIFVGRNKAEMIGLFLALLELIRQHRIRITQEKQFGPITIHLVDPAPLEEPAALELAKEPAEIPSSDENQNPASETTDEEEGASAQGSTPPGGGAGSADDVSTDARATRQESTP